MSSQPEWDTNRDLTADFTSEKKYWVVTADMGYGHQRAIYPLKHLSVTGNIININSSPYTRPKEQRQWKEMLRFYEFVSRAGRLPLVGGIFSRFLDKLLYIPKFYPRKDRSFSTFQVRYLRRSIKKGLCRGFLDHIKGSGLPVLTSFYAPAIAADMETVETVFCIICDTDLNRVWVRENASSSRIIYFAPGTVAAQRLHSYGVPEKNILLTGFPLPPELLGSRQLDILRKNLARRLVNLDPKRSFFNLHRPSIAAYLPELIDYDINISDTNIPLTITFAVGGAGAQKETGRQLALNLAGEINSGRIKLNLVAGTRTEVRDFFIKTKEETGCRDDSIQVIYGGNNEEYFALFNKCLHDTDILWTKPSELSFYCALGLPVIISPDIGPQEKCNRRWLLEIGAGIKQNNPEYSGQWIKDLLDRGRLAEAAWNGFIKARKYGLFNILDFLESGSFVSSNDPLKR
jgi:hypothetical protein